MRNFIFTILLFFVIQTVKPQLSITRLPCDGVTVVTDHEGNTYHTVQIGNQCWLSENMRCRTSPTGKLWLHNPVFSVELPIFKSYFITVKNSQNGNLYNWSAAMDLNINEYAFYNANGHQRGICPKGWHIPNSFEWTSLLEALGGTREAGAMMKSLSSQWIKPVVAKEVSGFDAEPSGVYTEEGLKNTGNYAYFWSSTTFDRQNAWCCGLYSYNSDCYNILDYKCYGRSVRCLKD